VRLVLMLREVNFLAVDGGLVAVWRALLCFVVLQKLFGVVFIPKGGDVGARLVRHGRLICLEFKNVENHH